MKEQTFDEEFNEVDYNLLKYYRYFFNAYVGNFFSLKKKN